MTRREVGLSIAVGVAILVLAAGPFPVLRGVLQTTINFWYVGVGALAAAFVARRSSGGRDAGRVLGLIGIAWVTVVLGAFGTLLFLLYTTTWGR